MTQRIHPLAPSVTPRRTLRARDLALKVAADAAPRGAADRAWSLGYMAVALLTIAAACAVTAGETAHAELQLATAAIGAVALPQDICSAGGDRPSGPVKQACASAQEHGSDAAGVC